MGLDFDGLKDDLDDETYPLSNPELLEAYGDREIEHSNGTVSLREVLESLDDETYDSSDEIQQTVLNMVGEQAIGRKEYSDRESNDTGTDFEQQSF